jgi:hypothetical protein
MIGKAAVYKTLAEMRADRRKMAEPIFYFMRQ